MTTSRVGPFELVDPPTAEAEQIARRTLEAIRYPWPADLPTIRVEWDDVIPNTASGLYYAGSNRVVLDLGATASRPEGMAFVLAHELGHMIDDEVLTDRQRDELLELMHVDPPQLGHFNHDHPDAGHDTTGPAGEVWANGSDAYVSRVYEAWADLFVATYAPTIWDGTALGTGRRYPRFVHWTEDLDEVAAIVTPPSAPPAPREELDPMALPDVVGHARERVIRRAVRLGLMAPRPGGRFRPAAKVTRAELAESLVRTYDKARADRRQ